MTKPNPKRLQLILSSELDAAIRKAAKRRKVRVSDLVRNAVARDIDRPDLVDCVTGGRPPNKDD